MSESEIKISITQNPVKNKNGLFEITKKIESNMSDSDVLEVLKEFVFILESHKKCRVINGITIEKCK